VPQLDAALVKLRYFLIKHSPQDGKEALHLSLWAPPVLSREGVDRQVPNTEFYSSAEDTAEVLHASAMASDPRQPATAGPATVAIHDDAHVLWHVLQRGIWAGIP
jgi:hypothetical protein